jgi:hypothetical protein
MEAKAIQNCEGGKYMENSHEEVSIGKLAIYVVRP